MQQSQLPPQGRRQSTGFPSLTEEGLSGARGRRRDRPLLQAQLSAQPAPVRVSLMDFTLRPRGIPAPSLGGGLEAAWGGRRRGRRTGPTHLSTCRPGRSRLRSPHPSEAGEPGKARATVLLQQESPTRHFQPRSQALQGARVLATGTGRCPPRKGPRACSRAPTRLTWLRAPRGPLAPPGQQPEPTPGPPGSPP